MRMRFYGALFLVVGAYGHTATILPKTRLATVRQVEQHGLPAPAQKPPTAEKKSAWVRTKKHLKRYWRRYAIATAAILIAIDQLRSQRVNRTAATEQLTSVNPPSPLERLAAYQYRLILRALQWSPSRLLRLLKNSTRIGTQQALLLRKKTSDFIAHRLNAFKKRQSPPEELSRRFQTPEITLQDLKDLFALAPKTPFTLKTGKHGTTLQGIELVTVTPAFTDNVPVTQKTLQIFNYGTDKLEQYGVDANGSLYKRFYRADKESDGVSQFFEVCDICELRGMVVGYTDDHQPLFAAGPQESNPVNGVEYTPTTKTPGKSKEPLMPIAQYNAFRLKIVPSFDPAGNYLGVPTYDNKPFKALSSQRFTPPTLLPGIVNANLPEFFNLPPGSTALTSNGCSWRILGYFFTDIEVDKKQPPTVQSATLQRICSLTPAQGQFGLYAIDAAGNLYVNRNERSPSADCYRCTS